MVKYDRDEKRLIIPADINYSSLEEYKRGYREGYEDGYASGITACTTDYSKEAFTIECISLLDGYDEASTVVPPSLYFQINDGPVLPPPYHILEDGTIEYVPSTWKMNIGDTIRMWASTATTMDSFYYSFGASYWGSPDHNYGGMFNIYGNILSIQYGFDFQDQTTLLFGFGTGLFRNYTGLTDASNLILQADTLTSSCYNSMFYGCTGLTSAPELPATTLASTCYRGMFSNCISLTEAPELPATTLEQTCYAYMFQGCTSLRNAPELPAETLKRSCYQYMFSGCTSLDYVVCYAATFGTNSTGHWLDGVSPTGTFVTPSTTTWDTGVSGIPEGWTRVDA